ncbi:hypothetical protein A3844_09615 [Paenibacillus helianthi]|uniref:Copper amine oxidase-like N-terminal domain-containing protein n=2 Tax=Paenibacillus helianthi TaxID=1349432 RepID=A0ABX3ETM0_9BACL|nr:hypothetical protein A3844_09615 [Paenibacillus helianthi]
MKNLNMSKIAVFFLAFVLTVMSLGPAAASAAAPNVKTIRVFVQSKEIHPKAAPILQGGRVYIEFRSVVLALGFKFNYDAAKKVITADSEDTSFKIDLKSGKTFLNGREFTYSKDAPMILGSGANVLVMNHLFNATSNIRVNYDAVHKNIVVYQTEAESVDYLSLANKEAVVPDADKVAIYTLLDKYIQAMNDEDALALMAVDRSPEAYYTNRNLSKDQVKLLLENNFLKHELKYTKKQATVVSYGPNKATVYFVYTVSDKDDKSSVIQLFYYLKSVVKASDGKWYLDNKGDTVLHVELLLSDE